ncbi:MAG: CBS domain-containing protein [Nitrososphaeria archaeon]
MSKDVYVVQPNDTLARAKNLMISKKVGRLIVMEQDMIVGILTREDLAKALLPSKPSLKARPIDQLLVLYFMKKNIVTIEYNADIGEAAKIMLDKKVGGLPVTWSGKLAGIITTHDITKYVAQLKTNMLVKEHMRGDLSFASPFHSISHVSDLLFKNPIHRVIVIDNKEKPVGIISPSNLAFVKFAPVKKILTKRSVIKGGEATHMKINYIAIATAGDIMSTPVIIVHEYDHVETAASIMVSKDIGALPVLDPEGRVSGIFSKYEVLSIASKKR